MSYNCTISFKKIELKDVYKFFQQYKKFIIENLNKIVEDEYMWCPSVKCKLGKIEYKELTSKDTDIDKQWFCNIFKHRFFYDDEFGLLGVYSVPNVAKTLFDKSIYFQDSCDQDYDFKDWEGVKEFENIYNECMKLPDENFEKPDKWSTLKEDYYPYYKRSLAYDKIWERYEWSLYKDDDILYISLFNLWDDLLYAERFTINCYKKFNEFWDDTQE